jgi:predicted dehydrogenase
MREVDRKELPPRLEEAEKIGVGVVGYGMMGQIHSHGFTAIPMYYWPVSVVPHKVAICGRTESKVKLAAETFGYQKYYTDYRDLIKDPDVELVDVCTPHDFHHDQSIAAAEAGKHVICEKPVALNLKDAREMYEAVKKADVKNMIAFNYRFFPAVTLAKRLIEEGYLGQILQFRGYFLYGQSARSVKTPLTWRVHRETSGRGMLGGVGSHIADLARFLVGDVKTVSGLMGSFAHNDEAIGSPDFISLTRARVDERVFLCTMQFESGAIGTLEGSRYSTGRTAYERVEVHGTEGAAIWNLNRLNELQVYSERDPKHVQGFKNVLVLEPSEHPFMDKWYRAHPMGYDRGQLHMLLHFIECIVNDKDPRPQGATFYDGMKNQEILDAIAKSTKEEKWINLPL